MRRALQSWFLGLSFACRLFAFGGAAWITVWLSMYTLGIELAPPIRSAGIVSARQSPGGSYGGNGGGGHFWFNGFSGGK